MLVFLKGGVQLEVGSWLKPAVKMSRQWEQNSGEDCLYSGPEFTESNPAVNVANNEERLGILC